MPKISWRTTKKKKTNRTLLGYFFVASIFFSGFTGLIYYQWETILHALALTSVTIANGNTTLADTDDLSSQTVALAPDTGAYTWSRDGNTLMEVNFPFHTGLTQNDYSTNGFTAPVSGGATFTTGCQVGVCFEFDGVDDTIDMSSAVARVSGHDTAAISFWFKSTDTTADHELVWSVSDKDAAFENAAISIGDYTTGFADESIGFSVQSGTNLLRMAVRNGHTAYKDQAWHHFVVNIDGVDNTIYVDGVKQAVSFLNGSVTTTEFSDIANPDSSYIMRRIRSGDDFFGKGQVDEFLFFPQPLDQTRVTQLYNDGNAGLGGPTIIDDVKTVVGEVWSLSITPISSTGVIGSTVAASNTTTITSALSINSPADDEDLVATVTGSAPTQFAYRWRKNGTDQQTRYYPGNTGTTQTDLSGNSADATLVNGASYTASGRVGGGILFDGSNDYFRIPASANLDATLVGAYTVSVWAYRTKDTSTSGWTNIFDNPFTSHTPPYYNLYLRLNNQEVPYAYHSDFGSVVGLQAMPKNEWVHFALVVDPFSGMYLYMNGELQQANHGTPGTPLTNYSQDFIFGSLWCCATSAYTFGGTMDEMMISNRAFTDSEIMHLYTQGNAGLAAPTIIDSQHTSSGDTWDMYYIPIDSGSVGAQVTVGSPVISAAESTTVVATTPSGTQTGAVEVSYTCSNSASDDRDLFIEFSTNGGGAFSPAMVTRSSSGTALGSYIEDVTCDGTTQTFEWGSIGNVVAKNSTNATVQIRITPMVGGSAGTTSNFTVSNPVNLCDLVGEASDSELTAAETSYDGGDISIFDCFFRITGTHSFTNVYVGAGGSLLDYSYLSHADTTTSTEYKMDITSSGVFNVEGGWVSANARGYKGGATGYTNGNTTVGGSTTQNGGSHGGLGGYPGIGTTGATYGSVTAPTTLGAGGGAWTSTTTQDGGGAIKVTANSVKVNGRATSDGFNGTLYAGNATAGGAGGSVYFLVTNEFSGDGFISANGADGDGPTFAAGGGGGGRVAVNSGTNTYTGTYQARGGQNNVGIGGGFGGAGTIYVKTAAQTNGDLIIDNESYVPILESTPVPAPAAFDNVTVRDSARAVLTGVTSITSNLSVDDAVFYQGNTASPTITIGGNVDVTNGATLGHSDTTASQEYKLDLQVTGTITIDGTSSISADAKGYIEGTTAGYTNGNTTAGGSTFQNGGSHGGKGGSSFSGVIADTFGSFNQPDSLGGGGDRHTGGTAGDGGGAIKLFASSLVNSGIISADGGDATTGNSNAGGAGGSVWIDVDSLSGAGTITADGGDASGVSFLAGGGGGGRIAIYVGTNTFTGTIQAYGGAPIFTGTQGGAGTYYLKLDSQANGDLYIDNNDITPLIETTPIPSTPATLDLLAVSGAAKVLLSGQNSITGNLNVQDSNSELAFAYTGSPIMTIGGNISVTGGGAITTSATTTVQEYKVDLQVTGTTTIDASSLIHADRKGYRTGATGYTFGNTTTGGSGGQNGGSHGGIGGDMLIGSPANAFGNLLSPDTLGGGGGYHSGSNHTGHGGGAIKLSTSTLTVNGTLSADGGPGNSANNADGGGAGGSLWLDVDTLAGNGSISTDGGDAAGVQAGWGKGGGAGGRTAIYVGTNNFTGSITSYGGASNTGNHGAGGTTFIKLDAEANGSLTVDLNNQPGAFDSKTPLFVTSPGGLPTAYSFKDLSVINRGHLLVDSPCSGTALTVTGVTDTSGSGTIEITGPSGCTASYSSLAISNQTLAIGVTSSAYSDNVTSGGGYAPKTYECLDGLGGSVVACNTVMPTGLTMATTGAVSGTPSAAGTTLFAVRVTDSNPGGAEVDEATVTITVSSVPNQPTLVSPSDASDSGELSPTLTALYSDPDSGDTGTIEFRLSTGSAADCLNNVNVIATGSSAQTATNNENASFVVPLTLTVAQTYEWCARANDGANFSNSGNYTTMGSFVATEAGGSNQRFQGQQGSESSQEQSSEESQESDPNQESSNEEESETTLPPEESDQDQSLPIELETEQPIPIPIQEQEEAPGDLAPPPPQPEPTQQESSQIDDLVDELIQIEDDESPVPTTSQPDDQPTELGIETRSESDGRSFTVEVEDLVLEESLVVTGLATTDQDRIEFSGETSLPNSTVTLIFDDSVFVVVTSDEQGFWQAFVSAEELGVTAGQTRNVSVEVIAVKDNLRSDKVSVGEAQISLTTNEQVIADFDATVSDSAVMTIVERIQENIIEFFEEEEETIQRSLVVATPVVIVSSAPLWGYAPYIPTLSYQLFLWILGLFKGKRKEGRLYGVAYDSITKEPVALAIIRIYSIGNDKRKLVATIVTDKSGRYETLLQPGEYSIEAVKPQYNFPSTIVSTDIDGDYSHVSHGQLVMSENSMGLPDIPLDPTNATKNWELAGFLKKLVLALQKLGQHLALPLMVLGALSSFVLLINDSLSTQNWVLFFLYIGMVMLQLKLRSYPQKEWGIVYNLATGAALPLVTLQLIDPEFGKVVKSRLSDYEGRFAFLPEPGRYVVKASKSGYSQPEVVESTGDLNPIQGELEIKKEGEVIDGDIAMKSD